MIRLQTFFIFLIIFLGFPFYFQVFIGNNYVLIGTKVALLLILFLLRPVKKIPANVKRISLGLLLYSIVYIIINTKYLQGTIDPFFSILYGIVIWTLLKGEPELRNLVQKVWLNIMLFISVVTLVGVVAFLTVGGFVTTEIGDYEVFYNPFFGAFNLGRIRPEWYFAEPNYMGTYLILTFPFLWEYTKIMGKKKKIIVWLIWLAATALVNSFGAYLALGAGVLGYAVYKVSHISKKAFQTIAFFVVAVAVVAIPTFDNTEIRQSNDTINSSSLNDRQERTANVKEIVENVDLKDIFFGLGLNYTGQKYGKSASMTYYAILEYGIIFAFFYFFVILRLLNDNVMAQIVLLTNFFATEAFLNPLIILNIFVIYWATKENLACNSRELVNKIRPL